MKSAYVAPTGYKLVGSGVLETFTDDEFRTFMAVLREPDAYLAVSESFSSMARLAISAASNGHMEHDKWSSHCKRVESSLGGDWNRAFKPYLDAHDWDGLLAMVDHYILELWLPGQVRVPVAVGGRRVAPTAEPRRRPQSPRASGRTRIRRRAEDAGAISHGARRR